MSDGLTEYKKFIDSMVELRTDVLALWARERGWPDLPENRKYNELLKALTTDQRDVLAAMLQVARDSAIHDVLAKLDEDFDFEGLKIIKNGTELQLQPFGTEMHYDFICRREGDEWPNNQD
jgi:hypothetical protein